MYFVSEKEKYLHSLLITLVKRDIPLKDDELAASLDISRRRLRRLMAELERKDYVSSFRPYPIPRRWRHAKMYQLTTRGHRVGNSFIENA